MKLSLKASLLLTVLVLLVITATSVFLFEHQQGAVKAYILHELESAATATGAAVAHNVDDKLRAAAAVAGNLPARMPLESREEARRALALEASFFPSFDAGLFLLDKAGRMVADYPPHPELEGRSFDKAAFFLRTMSEGRGVVSESNVCARTGLPVLTFTAPVRSPDGLVEYVLCGSASLASPDALGAGARFKVGRGGWSFVAERSGTILAHPRKDLVFRKMDEGANPFLDAALAGYEGIGEAKVPGDGEVLAASRRIPGLGWVVVAQVPAREASQALREGHKTIGLFFLAALAIVLPLGFWAMRRITRPLEDLEKAARIIAQDLRGSDGVLSRPFASSALHALRKMGSGDEIGRLARAFFQLSVRLKQTLASLRSAVQDWERTFSSVQEAVLVLDADGSVLRCNRAAEDLLRLIKADIIGRHWRELLSGGRTPPAEWPTAETLAESGRFKAATSLPGREGIFELAFSAIQGRREAKGYLLTVTDATERFRGEERIRELAFHDPLTRLPNRVLLADRLEQAIATAERNGTRAGVLFLDLDDFKKVNDTFGHDAGDEVLRQAARRLASCLRVNDTLARYAGDEFVCVLMDLGGQDEAVGVAARMLDVLGEPFDIPGERGGKAHVGVSIGIALYPEDGARPGELLSRADTAMYRAKGRGKNGFRMSIRPRGGSVEAGADGAPRQ